MRRLILSLGLAGALSATAAADLLVVPLTGFSAEGDYGDLGNSFTEIPLPVGTTIDDVSYVDLAYTANSPSWQSELALSVNDSFFGVDGFYDALVLGAPDSSGSYGPVSANFADGTFIGGPFALTTGILYIETYDIFPDGSAIPDQIVTGGALHITYTVPEPASIGLIGLGALAFFRRR